MGNSGGSAAGSNVQQVKESVVDNSGGSAAGNNARQGKELAVDSKRVGELVVDSRPGDVLVVGSTPGDASVADSTPGDASEQPQCIHLFHLDDDHQEVVHRDFDCYGGRCLGWDHYYDHGKG